MVFEVGEVNSVPFLTESKNVSQSHKWHFSAFLDIVALLVIALHVQIIIQILVVVLAFGATAAEQKGKQDLNGICFATVPLLGAKLVLKQFQDYQQAGEFPKLFFSCLVWGKGLKSV